ncbi:MAG: hypothetical protein C5B52_00275 [Bacteroidetes bacterium]|nr:MAG: hypothetical protein C5B52_00275 [Bacteroidota bacterium]
MKSKLLALAVLFVASSNLIAQNSNPIELNFKYKIWITTTSGNLIKGVLLSVSDSSVKIFPGTYGDLKKQKNYTIINQDYSTISEIKIKKRAGWLKGMGIGALIGASPVLFGEAGAYVAIVSFPLGVVVGTIVGATSKKKFEINAELQNFNKFRHKVSKK